MQNKEFWNRKKVLITGHTGFKGTWLTLWLASMGAEVSGYSLNAPSILNMCEITKAQHDCVNYKGDITNYPQLLQYIKKVQPEIIFHLAAQPLVRKSYYNPIETFETNVLGTVHLLEASRTIKSVKVIINVTSDKCYENNENIEKSFCENDRMGGHDPYSASKGCAELVTESYRRAFFKGDSYPRLASVRAGNVIGGGDWGEDRLVPDMVRAFCDEKKVSIRNPNAVRPWQHVMDPLNGYLFVAEKLWGNGTYSEGWNFGPIDCQNITVDQFVKLTMDIWGKRLNIDYDLSGDLYEQKLLSLDSGKAVQRLGWKPKLSQVESIRWTIEWYKKYEDGMDMKLFTLDQIQAFEELKGESK